MRKILFIYNPVSGKKTMEHNVGRLVAIMNHAGFDVTLAPTKGAGDAYRMAKDVTDDYDRVIVGGGDGTLHEAVEGMKGKKIPLGYIPAGSTNDFAVTLGLRGTLEDKAHIAVSDNVMACDTGKLNDKTFLYVAAFGTLSSVSYSASQDLKNIIGGAAYILEGLKTFNGIETVHMQVSYDGQIVDGDFCYGMITNAKHVAGVRMNYAKDVKLDDGKFEVILIRKPQNPIEIGTVAREMILPQSHPDMLVTIQTDHIHFHSDQPVAWDLDGEYGGSYCDTEITVENQTVRFLHGEDSELIKKLDEKLKSQFS